MRGAIVERNGKRVRVTARRGVVLACGGFPHDVARRKAMFPHAPTGNEHFSPGPVGNTGSLTCVFGAIQRGVPFYRSAMNEWGEHSAACDIPAELLIMDLFFHRSFEFARAHETILYSELGAPIGHTGRERERKRLPLNDRVLDLGDGPLPVATPEVPRYNQMVQAAFRRAGWNPTEFFGLRLKVAYPAMPAALVVRYRLPQAP